MSPPMQSTLVRHVRNTKPTETASWSRLYDGNRLKISESDLRSSATNKRRQHNVNVHSVRIFVSHVSVSAYYSGFMITSSGVIHRGVAVLCDNVVILT